MALGGTVSGSIFGNKPYFSLMILFFGLILGGSRHRDKEGHRSHNMKFATGRDQMREQ